MVFAAFGFTLALTTALPPAAAVQLPDAASAQVAGRVVDAISRAPIAGATVTLTPLPPPPWPLTSSAVTDADGNFVFQRLRPGEYLIDAQKTGFARMTDRSGVPTIAVSAGQSVTDVEMALHGAAVIAGRILDASGGPPPLLKVVALTQWRRPDGRPLPIPKATAQTNTLGEFRLENLGDGDYIVLAVPPPPAGLPTPAEALAPTYYPRSPSSDTAHVFSIVAGQVVDNVEFSLLLLTAHEVSGVVVDEAGSGVADAVVTLVADPTMGVLTPATAQTDNDGAFRLSGVISGPYRLTIETRAPSPHRTAGFGGSGSVIGVVLAAPLQITVGDTDVTGLRIVLSSR